MEKMDDTERYDLFISFGFLQENNIGMWIIAIWTVMKIVQIAQKKIMCNTNIFSKSDDFISSFCIFSVIQSI